MRRALAATAVLLMLAGVVCAQEGELAAKSHRAKQLMAEGRYDQALQLYRQLVRALPNNPGLMTDLGLALDLAGRKREAIRQYEAVLRLDPQAYPALLLLGIAHLDLGEPAAALGPIEAALKLDPESFEAQEAHAEALLGVGRAGEAVRAFEQLAHRDPANPKAWFGLGLSYDALAQASFDALAEVAPGSPYWLDLVAESRLETQQDYSAFFFYRQALAKWPELRGAHAAIAEIYRNNGHADWAAIEEAKERQLPAPDCAAHPLECKFQAGDYTGIMSATESAHSAEEYYWRTRAANRLALEAYTRLNELPPSVETHELRARIESKRRQYAEAAKQWREALKLSPGNAHIRKELAIALFHMGDLEEARALFDGLLQLEPDDPDLNYFLGDTLLNSQNPQQAIPYLEKAIRRNPQLLGAQKSLGLAYMQTGQAAKAISHLKQALPIDEDGSVHYQLGRAYQLQGQQELARVMFARYAARQREQQAENRAVAKEAALTPPE
jgi:tetratricopeptide (TPR) repeat protein